MRKAVIYPGRFQPMLRHHAEVFQTLRAQFPDAEVYLSSTNKTDSDSSPFSFREKQQIASQMYGIDSSKMLEIPVPYNVDMYDFDPDNTLLIMAVGGKDYDRFPVKNVNDETGLVMKKTADEPARLQPIDTMKGDPLPMKQRAYIAYAPTVEDQQGDVRSASAFRQQFKSAPDKQTAQKVFTRHFGEYNEEIFNLVYDRLVEQDMNESINTVRKLAGLPEVHREQEVTQEAAPVDYAMTDAEKQLAELGRTLMDNAMQENSDKLSNYMSLVGRMFTEYGTNEGAKSLPELADKLKMSEEEVLKFAAYAQKLQQEKEGTPDNETEIDLSDFYEGEVPKDEFDEASPLVGAAASVAGRMASKSAARRGAGKTLSRAAGSVAGAAAKSALSKASGTARKKSGNKDSDMEEGSVADFHAGQDTESGPGCDYYDRETPVADTFSHKTVGDLSPIEATARLSTTAVNDAMGRLDMIKEKLCDDSELHTEVHNDIQDIMDMLRDYRREIVNIADDAMSHQGDKNV
jgi:predicted transcriptional regulator